MEEKILILLCVNKIGKSLNVFHFRVSIVNVDESSVSAIFYFFCTWYSFCEVNCCREMYNGFYLCICIQS